MEQFIQFYFKLRFKYKDIRSMLYRSHYPNAEPIRCVNLELPQKYVDVKKLIRDPEIIN